MAYHLFPTHIAYRACVYRYQVYLCKYELVGSMLSDLANFINLFLSEKKKKKN